MPPQYPRLLAYYPKESDGLARVDQPIVMDWSSDLEVGQFTDDAQRARLVQLILVTTAVIVPTTFGSYDPRNKRLVLRPSTALEYGETYRVVVNTGVRDTYGRRSVDQYTWTFKVEGGALGRVELLSPTNFSVQPIFPELVWSAVVPPPPGTGSITYRVEVDNNPGFVSPTWSGDVVDDTSIIPPGVFTPGLTYYWRVRAFTDTATGSFSEVWGFFYGSIAEAHGGTRRTYPEVDTFRLVGSSFENGLSNLPGFPDIVLEFSVPLATAEFGSNVITRFKAVYPRVDDPDSFRYADWPGSWIISGSTATFIPSGSISRNTRYEIVIGDRLLSDDGRQLGESHTLWFTSEYDPYYVSLEIIRSRFMVELSRLPDDLINLYIHRASLDANARYYGILHTALVPGLGTDLSEAAVRDEGVLSPGYGIAKWTEALACYNLLKLALMEEIRNVGRSRRLGDYQEELSRDFVDAVKAALDEVEKELDEWEEFLSLGDSPTSAVPSELWSPAFRRYDWSVKDIEAQRGGEF